MGEGGIKISTLDKWLVEGAIFHLLQERQRGGYQKLINGPPLILCF